MKGNKKMSDCIFCKIAAGEIPSATLYEDENFRVILDLGPATYGHALILPKERMFHRVALDKAIRRQASRTIREIPCRSSADSVNTSSLFSASRKKKAPPNARSDCANSGKTMTAPAEAV